MTTTTTKKEPPISTLAELLEYCLDIRREYEGQGLTLTLRQMYYQLVARGHLENGQRHYKRVGALLTKARYDGSFPVDGLVDRGRSVQRGSTTRCDTSVEGAVESAANWVKGMPEFLMQTDRWFGQDVYVSVWVEKEALAEVFEQTCDELGVGWFACKGYPSVSALYQFLAACRRATRNRARDRGYSFSAGTSWSERHCGQAKKIVVLYFGDFDPDGWEIPRSCERNLEKLQRLGTGKHIPIEFKRIALNMEQIEEHDPPPFPAKVSSSRYEGYIDEHGTDDAWELDALDPMTLRALIEESVGELFDEDVHEREQDLMRERQGELRSELKDPDFMLNLDWGDEEE